ncbi:MAG TPA: hypothetical protein PLH37_02465 [bacterium]|mgnify:CR=1 FL=1|nr:hypothetical protein [bacterium]
MIKKIVIILSILAIAISLACLAYLFLWPKQELVNNELDGAIDTSDWKTYRNKTVGFEIKYPKNFYLLDRLSKPDKQLLISDEEILFNEFLNGYFAPIIINISDKSQDMLYVNSIINKQEITSKNSNLLIIKGEFPMSPPYKKFKTAVAIFNKEGITLKVNDVRTFVGNQVSFDYEKIFDRLVSTINFK